MQKLIQRLKSITKKVKKEIFIYKQIIRDMETPFLAKFFLGLTIAYLLSPIDLIPDFIPVLGYLDDLLIVPLLIYISFRFIPKHIVIKYRRMNTI